MIEEFSESPKGGYKDGRRNQCKACMRAYYRAYRKPQSPYCQCVREGTIHVRKAMDSRIMCLLCNKEVK